MNQWSIIFPLLFTIYDHRYESHVQMQTWGAKHITPQSEGMRHGYTYVFLYILYSTCFSICFDFIGLEKFIHIYIAKFHGYKRYKCYCACSFLDKYICTLCQVSKKDWTQAGVNKCVTWPSFIFLIRNEEKYINRRKDTGERKEKRNKRNHQTLTSLPLSERANLDGKKKAEFMNRYMRKQDSTLREGRSTTQNKLIKGVDC